MKIGQPTASYPPPVAPAKVQANPDPKSSATEAGSAPRPVAPNSAAAMASVSRFAAIMNMARPENSTFGDVLRSPHNSLTLRAPVGAGSGDTAINVTGQTLGETGNVDASPEGLAREMVEQLGDGRVITLIDAERALYVPREGMYVNSRDRITEYFNRLDSDRSGALTLQEVTRLLQHYKAHQDPTGSEKPRLPATWA